MPSYLVAGQDTTNVYARLADDWWCDGRPITAIRWWGSYLGNSLPDRPSVAPVGFILRWYTNKPGSTFDSPGGVIKEITVPLASGVGTPVPGNVYESPYCLLTKGTNSEYEFEYYLKLEDPWVEKEDDISPLEHALYDGEDFELLFTVRESQKDAFIAAWSKKFELECSCIGTITEQINIISLVNNGSKQVLSGHGYEHF